MHNNNEQKNKELAVLTAKQLPFFQQLAQYALIYSKEELLDTTNCHLDLFEVYLDTEVADDVDLRREMLMSTIRVKELAAIINGFKPKQIRDEALKLVKNA